MRLSARLERSAASAAHTCRSQPISERRSASHCGARVRAVDPLVDHLLSAWDQHSSGRLRPVLAGESALDVAAMFVWLELCCCAHARNVASSQICWQRNPAGQNCVRLHERHRCGCQGREMA